MFKEKPFEEFISKEKKSLISGPFGSNISAKFFVEDGVPVIRGNNLSLDFIKFIDKGFAFITDQKADELNTYALENDLVFTAVGTIGQVGIIPENSKFEKYIISNKQLRVRLDKNKLSPMFAFYWFTTPWMIETIKSRNVGSTVPLINLSIVRNLPVRAPECIDDQERIIKVLSDLDAKIELNYKINAELEAMAKTLYDYWFVQFDFPNANGKPYKTFGGKMVYNEDLKREIPEGWKVCSLSDIANITMGQSPPGESYNEDGIGSVFYQGSTDFGNRYPTIRKFTTSPSRFARQEDILLSVRAPVGTMNIAKEDCCIGRGLAALNSKDNCMSYLYEVMIDLKQIFDRRNVNGTTFGSITKDDLFSLKVVRPSSEILEKYNNITKPCFKQQNNMEEENQKLASLRDWLLPMLMNGQVTVGEAEEQLGMVAEGNVSYKKV